ncbi:hypothetical protein CEE35_08315 [Candidatus Aerophobetes bacterium Ae_b3b]|nr:MAG: hypothetical protein CEE35_08315 [Candidatus Aerophobetes bacterium Ae_b3b]
MKRNLVTSLLVLCLVLSVGPVFESAAQGKTTLTYFSWGLAEEIWGGWIRDIVAKYEEQNPGIKIELQSTTFADKETVYTTRCEAGVGPDIGDFSFDVVPLFAKKGYIMSVNTFIEQEEPEFIETWSETAISALTVDGNVYMIPGSFYPWLLVYNSKLFGEAGLDPCHPPKTMEEFLENAKVLTRDTDDDGKVDQWGFGMTAARTLGLFSRFSGFVWSAGGDYLTKDLSSSALNSPEALEGFKFFVELATKHKVAHPGAVEMGPHDVRIALANEKVAMNVGTAFTPGIVDGINPELNAFKVLQFAPFPSYGEKPVFTQATLVGQVISAQTKHPQEAWDFVKYVNNYENQLETWYVNGWTSARRDVTQSEAITSDKFGRLLVENQDRVKFPPAIEEWPETADIVITALQNALTGVQTPEEALAEAHDRINDLLGR